MKKQYVMKSTLVALGLCSAIGAGWNLTNVHAQADAGGVAAGGKKGGKKSRAKSIKELNQIESITGPLTPEQRDQIEAAMKTRDEAMEKARDDYMTELSKVTKMTPDELSQKLKEARKADGGKKGAAATPAG